MSDSPISQSRIAHEYDEPNHEYLAAYFEREEDGPMWALNLMKYREKAVYAGVESDKSGLEADNLYNPTEQIEAVGGRMVLVAPVEKQLRGDGITWDRIAVVLYPTRMSFIEMGMRKDFQKQHEHKNAGMETTIVVASMPEEGDPHPEVTDSTVGTGDRLLLQVVTDAAAPDLADSVESSRIGRFGVEGNIFGDERQWAEGRWDRISAETADALMSEAPVEDADSYVMVLVPQIDTLAESVVTPLP